MRAKLIATALITAVGLALIPPAASAAAPSSQAHLSVMTRNLDLGTDYGPALGATDAASFVHGVSTMYNEIAASNIPERATGIAAEIGQAMPDVVSLQEVSLVQRLVPTETGLVPIETIDQLAALMAALDQLGLHYTVASTVSEFDVTAPSDAGYYLRVRDGEALLVRSDQPAKNLSFTNPQVGHFSPSTLLTLGTPAGPVTALRGWTSVDVTTAGVTTRVIDTHLEALSPAAGAAQAAEILSGPANTALPVVLAGDLNSGPGTDTSAYNVIDGTLDDTWSATKPHDLGLTWGLHGEDAFPYASTPTQRIDLIFTRGLTPITDVLVGTTDLTPSGLNPSDHAGVLARLASPTTS